MQLLGDNVVSILETVRNLTQPEVLGVADTAAIYDKVMEAGKAHGLKPFGMFALDSLRLEKGYRAWKGDLSTDYSLLEGGLDYGLRWGIEPMFSDFKSRGFGLTQSHIERPERLERLILVMAIAMYWAVSCGAAENRKAAERGEKGGSANA